MYFTGISIAVMTFLTIGIWHPIVIKTEYHWGTRPWVVYLLVGILCCIIHRKRLSLFVLGRLWRISTLWYRRVVPSEKKSGERLVPYESQT